jgi:hypothetical protein
LTAADVKSITAPGYYADGGGLYLRVAPGGSKGWIFRFEMHSRRRDCGLGSYPDVSLANARENSKVRKENDGKQWQESGALDARACPDLPYLVSVYDGLVTSACWSESFDLQSWRFSVHAFFIKHPPRLVIPISTNWPMLQSRKAEHGVGIARALLDTKTGGRRCDNHCTTGDVTPGPILDYIAAKTRSYAAFSGSEVAS